MIDDCGFICAARLKEKRKEGHIMVKERFYTKMYAELYIKYLEKLILQMKKELCPKCRIPFRVLFHKGKGQKDWGSFEGKR